MTCRETFGSGPRIGIARITTRDWKREGLRSILKGRRIASTRRNQVFGSACKRAGLSSALTNIVRATCLVLAARETSRPAPTTLDFAACARNEKAREDVEFACETSDREQEIEAGT